MGLLACLKAGDDLLCELNLMSPECEQQSDETPRGLVVAVRPGARYTTIVFSGNVPHFTLPPILTKHQESNLILIRDSSRCFGLAGIKGLGSDYEVCLISLRGIITALGDKGVFCIGISAGGAAALRYGCDLKVAGVLGFSAPTTLNLSDDSGAELKDHPQLTGLYRRARHLGIDLAEYYQLTIPRPQVILVYGEKHRRDCWLAHRMLGIPGVTLSPIPFSGHASYGWSAAEGQLPKLLERLFSLEPFGGTLP